MSTRDQKTRFSEQEMGVIIGLFKDNDELLFAVRKVMFQADLTDQEKELLKNAFTDVSHEILAKTFLPTLDAEAPLFQITDLVVGLGNDLKNIGVDASWPLIRAKDLEIRYIAQQLRELKEMGSDQGSSKPIKFKDMAKLEAKKTEREDVFVNITAYTWLIGHIETRIQETMALANGVEETLEELENRMEKDSAN